MKLRQTIIMVASLALLLGVVACSNNQDETTTDLGMDELNAYTDSDYIEKYSRFYTDNIEVLDKYNMYESLEATNEYYTTNAYPGNDVYLSDLRTAYEDSRDNIQNFVDSLTNDGISTNEDIQSLNDQLVTEGQKLIDDINARLNQLDEVPDDAMNQEQNDFINTVNTTTTGTGIQNSFNNLLKDMNEMLGINNK